MLVVVSDTHSSEGHRLRGHTHSAVRDADVVIHAGDFYREPVLDAFYEVAGSLRAVYGNNDDRAIRDRIPEIRVVEYGGVRFAVTHRHRSGDTGLTMLGRERDADVVIHGHSHAPRVHDAGDVVLLNPGSHAQPRGNRPAHAELERAPDGLDGRLVTPDGEVFEEFVIDQ